MKKVLSFLKNVFLDKEHILYWLTLISFLGVLFDKNGNSSVPAIFFVGAIIVRVLIDSRKK